MATIRELVKQVTADKKVTQQEWSQLLRPATSKLPAKVGADDRELLKLYLSDVGFESGAKRGLGLALAARGYPVAIPGISPNGSTTAAEAIRRNVAESDELFEALSKKVGRGSAVATVGVIEGNFDLTHPVLQGKTWKNTKEIAGNGKDDDRNGYIDDVQTPVFLSQPNKYSAASKLFLEHGTHVAGLAVQGSQRLQLMPLRAYDDSEQRYVESIKYAIKAGVRVINLSGEIDTVNGLNELKKVIRENPNVLFVKSAGNRSAQMGSGTYSPDKYLSANSIPNMVVVSNARADGTVGKTSNYGKGATVATRGTDVFSSFPRGGFREQTGTSQAAPQVAALAAKCLLLSPTMKPAVLHKLLQVASDPNRAWTGKVSSGGLVNADRMLHLAALHGLLRSGASTTVATRKLGLSAAESRTLVALLRQAEPGIA